MPDYVAFVANAETETLTKEERTLLGTVLLLKIPLLILVNQIERVPRYELKQKIDEIEHLINLSVIKKTKPTKVSYTSDLS